MNSIAIDYKPVVTNKEGIRRFIMACRLAVPAEMKQEEIANLLGLSRSTFAALLDLGRLPKSNSIPLESYLNMLRLLRPCFPGTEIEITEDDLWNLLLVEREKDSSIPSGLSVELKKQIAKEQTKEGGLSYEEVFEMISRRFEGLPKNGINYKDGSFSYEEASALVQTMIDGRYLPSNEIELAVMTALLEREDGSHDALWVRWLAGLMPATYNP